MLKKFPEFFIAVALSVLFTVAFMYATAEVPRVVNRLLLKAFPDWGLNWNLEMMGEVIRSLRPVGYVAFAIVLFLMFIGFIIRKGYLSASGSVALYLPTFGYFVSAMFFLTGIGVLRALWFPLFDLSPQVLRLGDIVFVLDLVLASPVVLVVWMTGGFTTNVNIHLSPVIMPLGPAVFFLGTTTWLYGKFKGFEIIDFWIYRYSRHPQYLGFLWWSYTLMSLAASRFPVKGGYVPPPTLLWLISTLTIIGVALHEENEMIKKYGEKYVGYRDNTPFMLPLPKQLSALITTPIRALLKKNWPENRKEIAYVIMVYGTALVLLSLPWAISMRV